MASGSMLSPIQPFFPKQQQQRHSSPSPLGGGEAFLGDTFKALPATCYGKIQSIGKISDDKINTDEFMTSNWSPIFSRPVNIVEDTAVHVASLKSSSRLQFSLLLENLGDIEDIVTRTDVARLERDILLHIGRLGALELFHACISRSTLSEPSAANQNFSECTTSLPGVQEKDAVIFRSGKKEERKSRRRRGSLKRISVADDSKSWGGTQKVSSRLSRTLIARSESEMSKAVKEVAELEKTRWRVEGEMRQGIGYERWAEAAGVDQKTLQQRLQCGWCSRDKLIRSSRSLVVYFAIKYRGMGIAFDDLLQAGIMGVLKGAERFDDTKGYRFSTYVGYWIRKSMLSLVAKHSKGIHIPVSMEKIVKRVQSVSRSFYDEEGRYPEDDEMAELTGLPSAKVRLARIMCSSTTTVGVVSLDQEMGSGGVQCRRKWEAGRPEEMMILRKQMREEVLEVLEGLHPREKQVLVLRYGLEDGRCKSLGEIGRLCHVTKEWIRKIEKQALAKIRRDVHTQTQLKPYLQHFYN